MKSKIANLAASLLQAALCAMFGSFLGLLVLYALSFGAGGSSQEMLWYAAIGSALIGLECGKELGKDIGRGEGMEAMQKLIRNGDLYCQDGEIYKSNPEEWEKEESP